VAYGTATVAAAEFRTAAAALGCTAHRRSARSAPGAEGPATRKSAAGVRNTAHYSPVTN